MSESPQTSVAEQQFYEPKVETFVNAVKPESRAYSIEGIPIPDFQILMETFSDPEFRPSVEFTVHRTEGDELVLDDNPDLPTFSGLDSLQRWIGAGLDATNFVVPPKGISLYFRTDFLEGPTDHADETENLHIDGGLGTFLVFEDRSTEIGDKYFQDVCPTENLDPAENGIAIPDLMNMLGEAGNAGDHLLSPEGSQTVLMGPECLHKPPTYSEGTIRPGVICFINEIQD